MKKLSIIIPCYNEQDNIIPLFEKLKNLINLDKNLEIIIIDNGSTDKTLNIIKNHLLYKNKSIILVRIKKNIGYGHGIMSGVYISTAKYISWCHSDLQTEPKYTYDAFKKNFVNLENQKCIIKGSRKGRNLFDIIFTLGMSLLSSILFMTKLSDVNAQPKIFPRHMLNLLDNPPNDFSLDLYLLIIAKLNKYNIINYPVLFKKRIAGEAKGAGGGGGINKIKLIMRTLKFVFNLKKYLKNNGNNST